MHSCLYIMLQGIRQGSVFLQFLFMVLEKKKVIVRCLPSCDFLTVSLYNDTMRTIDINYLLHI